MGYLRLLTHTDDILDILSFKFNVRVPTKHYSLLMYAQQPTSAERSVWSEVDPISGQAAIQRNWDLTPDYLATLDRAIGQIVDRLGEMVTDVNLFVDWKSDIHTAAHHSGTARMATSPTDGVCDADARVHGLQNLYVADGAVIPASGIANTGLTIAALALRVAEHVQMTVTAASV
jgi:choline dehydrogenase-like flavoprotein